MTLLSLTVDLLAVSNWGGAHWQDTAPPDLHREYLHSDMPTGHVAHYTCLQDGAKSRGSTRGKTMMKTRQSKKLHKEGTQQDATALVELHSLHVGCLVHSMSVVMGDVQQLHQGRSRTDWQLPLTYLNLVFDLTCVVSHLLIQYLQQPWLDHEHC